MHLEIRAGGLSGTAGVAALQNNFTKFTDRKTDVINTFKLVQSKTRDTHGGVGDMRSALSRLESRIQRENEELAAVQEVQRKTGSFIDLAISVDEQAAAAVNKNKNSLSK